MPQTQIQDGRSLPTARRGGAGVGFRSTLAAAVLVVLLVALILVVSASGLRSRPAVALWTTVFVAVVIQAIPFVVLGTLVSAVLATKVSPDLLARLSGIRPVAASAGGAVAGMMLPGCECGSIPIAARLMERGAGAPLALAFLCSAPATNPVVLVATSVAFPGQPRMVLARFAASLLAAFAVGALWSRNGARLPVSPMSRIASPDLAGMPKPPVGPRPRWNWAELGSTMYGDFIHAGGFLVVGAALTATLQTVVPRRVFLPVAGSAVASVVTMALLAVVLSVCSEADAFVASGLTQFSLSSRLVFLVVGPVVDLKLAAMHVGTFGRRFALRFLPLAFAVAVGSAVVVGAVLL